MNPARARRAVLVPLATARYRKGFSSGGGQLRPCHPRERQGAQDCTTCTLATLSGAKNRLFGLVSLSSCTHQSGQEQGLHAGRGNVSRPTAKDTGKRHWRVASPPLQRNTNQEGNKKTPSMDGALGAQEEGNYSPSFSFSYFLEMRFCNSSIRSNALLMTDQLGLVENVSIRSGANSRAKTRNASTASA